MQVAGPAAKRTFRSLAFMFYVTDVELRTIIDKLANFVARNGPEFEQMTMKKQQDNAKFQFLFGGEWHAYYKWRVMSEHQGQGSE